jgi:hypothetical protein
MQKVLVLINGLLLLNFAFSTCPPQSDRPPQKLPLDCDRPFSSLFFTGSSIAHNFGAIAMDVPRSDCLQNRLIDFTVSLLQNRSFFRYKKFLLMIKASAIKR